MKKLFFIIVLSLVLFGTQAREVRADCAPWSVVKCGFYDEDFNTCIDNWTGTLACVSGMFSCSAPSTGCDGGCVVSESCSPITSSGQVACGSECKVGNSCTGNYVPAADCGDIDALHPNFGCRSNQACCKNTDVSTCTGTSPTDGACPPNRTWTFFEPPTYMCQNQPGQFPFRDVGDTCGPGDTKFLNERGYCGCFAGTVPTYFNPPQYDCLTTWPYKGLPNRDTYVACNSNGDTLWEIGYCAIGVPACVPDDPDAVIQSAPVAEATVAVTNPILTWGDLTPAAWGTKCPQPNTNRYYLYVQECAATGPVDNVFVASDQFGPVLNEGQASVQFTGGIVGRSYCWKVDTTNGQGAGWGQTRRFHITANAYGQVFNDPGNTCSTSTPLNGLTYPTTVTMTGGGSDVTDNSTSAYSIPYPDGNTHTLTVTSIPPGFTCGTGCPNTCSKSGTSATAPGAYNFFLTTEREGWWQAVGAPIYAGNSAGASISVQSELPTASSRLIMPGVGGTAGALLRKSGNVDLGAGAVSNNLWNTVTRYRGDVMNYEYFVANMWEPGYSYSLASLNVEPSPPGLPYYYKSGASTAGGWSVSLGEKYIVFVSGNLQITNNISVAPGGFLAFIVSGSITVSPNVTTLHGIYLTSQDFVTQTSSPAADTQLNIEGNVIAWGLVDFNRDLNASNLTLPGEKVTFRTDLIENMPDNMKSFAMEWREVVSGTLETENP